MLLRTILIVCIILSSTACHHHRRVGSHVMPSTLMPVMKMRPVTIERGVQPFNYLRVLGRMNVLLKTGCAHPQILLKGNARDVQQVFVLQKNQAVTVTLGSGYPHFGPVSAIICTRYLNGFEYRGGGVVKAPQLRSAALDLTIDNAGPTEINGTIFLRTLKAYGSSNIVINGLTTQKLKVYTKGQPHIKLTGIIKLCDLDMLGDGYLSMYWVQSNYLTLRARGKSFMQLAGVANVLNAELWGNAKLNASFLRAKRVFVKTHDRSLAQITALERQHTKATDSSDIYFYKIPEMKTDFMAYNGAVLDMREFDAYVRHDYDRYNK